MLEDADLARVEELAGIDAGRPLLQAAVRSLADDQRAAVLARVVDERPYPEIAEEMECSGWWRESASAAG